MVFFFLLMMDFLNFDLFDFLIDLCWLYFLLFVLYLEFQY